MKNYNFLLVILCILLGASRADADEVTRRALVFGNDSYPGNGLKNARNDAKAVSAAFKKIGYSTTLVLDADRRSMLHAIDAYTSSINPGDVAVVYYAGHGMQMAGENYLIPVDFTLTTHTDPKQSAVSLTSLLDTVTRHGAATQIVILDACRNNPFLGDRSYGGGWASLGTSAGTFLAFGTSPGSTASDDPNSTHGLFTNALLKYLTSSTLDVEQMFQKVRLKVIRESSGEQVPWTASSLVGSFHILPQQDSSSPTLLSQLTNTSRRAVNAIRSAPRTLFQSQAAPSRTVDDLEGTEPVAAIQPPVRARDSLDSETSAPLQSAADLVRGGKIDEAISILQTVVANSPTGLALRLLGLVLQLASRNVEAVDVLGRALKLNPDDVSALTYRCIAQATTAPIEAVKDCRAALALSPSSAEAHLALSNVLLSLGQHQAAYTESERSIAAAPQSPLGFSLRGHISAAQKHDAQARQDYERATRLGVESSAN